MTKLSRIFPIIFPLLLTASLSACVAPAHKPMPVVEAAPPAAIIIAEPALKESMSDYVSNMMAASQETQKKELAQLTTSTAKLNQPDVITRVKLALLYGMPSSRVRDPAKAMPLLDELVRDSTLDTESRVLTTLLRDYQLESNKQAQRLRDEQKRGDTLQSKVSGLQSTADSAQSKADTLQRKLDELKNIEKTMTDRGQRPDR